MAGVLKVCCICGTSERLGWDHDPKTNEQRGRMCLMCKTDVNAVRYVNSHKRYEKLVSYLTSFEVSSEA